MPQKPKKRQFSRSFYKTIKRATVFARRLMKNIFTRKWPISAEKGEKPLRVCTLSWNRAKVSWDRRSFSQRHWTFNQVFLSSDYHLLDKKVQRFNLVSNSPSEVSCLCQRTWNACWTSPSVSLSILLALKQRAIFFKATPCKCYHKKRVKRTLLYGLLNNFLKGGFLFLCYFTFLIDRIVEIYLFCIFFVIPFGFLTII